MMQCRYGSLRRIETEWRHSGEACRVSGAYLEQERDGVGVVGVQPLRMLLAILAALWFYSIIFGDYSGEVTTSPSCKKTAACVTVTRVLSGDTDPARWETVRAIVG
jgi:hypothetical protein